MSYIVQRQDRFYVVAYDGLDPLTGRERRRWHPPSVTSRSVGCAPITSTPSTTPSPVWLDPAGAFNDLA